MKNKSLIAILIASIAVLAVGTFLFYSLKTPAGGLGGYQSSTNKVDVLGTTGSLSLISATTTKTLLLSKSSIDHVDLNVSANAKDSTTTVLSIVPYFSNAAGCGSSTDSSIKWFSETGMGVSGATVSLSAPLVYSYTMASGTNRFNLGWNNLAADCMRFDVYTSAMTTVSTTVWMEAVTKSN